MKIAEIRIQNFRSCADVTVPVNAFTALVGQNGSGKSTVLCALNVFFQENTGGPADFTQLISEDFHKKNTDDPIRITVTFTDLSKDARFDFADYYRQDKLVITTEAVFNSGTGKTEIKQIGQRLVMQEFAPYFEAAKNNATADELRSVYRELRREYPDLPAATTKQAMKEGLQAYEGAHLDQCKLLPSEDQFYGFSKGSNRLSKYIQWVYVPAVKDASTEQTDTRNSGLSKLLARVVRAKTVLGEEIKSIRCRAQADYAELLKKNQLTLDGISMSLRSRLADWAHPGATVRLEWWQDPDRGVAVQDPIAHVIAGEDQFEGQLCRLGHGFQRSYLLALLQELATGQDQLSPSLVLGCEEPELYQHPAQAQHLAETMRKLSTDNAQVLIATHSPYFVSGEAFEDVRLITKNHVTGASGSAHVTFSGLAKVLAEATGALPMKPAGVRAKIYQTLQPQLNAMFFARRLVLVEGLEDVAYLKTYLHLMNLWDEYRAIGCDIIPADGKDRLIQPLAVAKALGIPTVVIFDSDAHRYAAPDPSENSYAERIARRPMHERDNTALQRLAGIADVEAFPSASVFSPWAVIWHSEIGSVVEDEIGDEDWAHYKKLAEQELGQPGGLNKNSLQIAILLTRAWDEGKRSRSLMRACEIALGRPSQSNARPLTLAAGSSLPVGASDGNFPNVP